MYDNAYREWFLQIDRMKQGQMRHYLCKVVEFNTDDFTLKGEVITKEQPPFIIDKIKVFSSPLITTQLRSDDYVILIDLGFDLGNFWSDKTIGDSAIESNSLIALPLNMNPSKQGTTLQAPQQYKNILTLDNDSVTLQQGDSKLELNNAITLQDNRDNSLKTNAMGMTLSSNDLKLESTAPLDLNGASFANAMNAISSALTQINTALQTIKYTPGGSSVTPITIDTESINAVSKSVK